MEFLFESKNENWAAVLVVALEKLNYNHLLTNKIWEEADELAQTMHYDTSRLKSIQLCNIIMYVLIHVSIYSTLV